MPELKVDDKVVYGTFVGTVRQLVGEDMCVLALRAPMSDGAVTIHAPTEKCEVITSETEMPDEDVEGAPPGEEPPEPAPEEAPAEESPATAEEPPEAPEEAPAEAPTTEGEVIEPVT